MENSLQQASLFGYPVHLVTLAQAVGVLEESLLTGQNLHVVTLNPEMIMQGEQDEVLAGILKSAGLILPDGAGLVWALKTRRYPGVIRVPGIEFSEEALAQAAKKGYRVAVIGARPDVLSSAVNNLEERYPGLQIVYQHHGFFESPEQEQSVAEACAATQPHIVLVALGVPKQEKWVARYSVLFQGAALIGVGGSLDVWSGMTRRAPYVFRLLNLEWLYRITSEPWRIKRTYKTLPLFVVKVMAYNLGSPRFKTQRPPANPEVPVKR